MAEKEAKGSGANPMTLREVLPPRVKTTPETVARGLQDSVLSVKTLPKGETKLMEAAKNKTEKTA